MADHADDDELLAAAAAPAAHDDDAALLAAAGAPAPEKRSFLGEAAHRAADFGRGVAENVKNIPSTSWARIKANAKTLGHPFAEAGREVADEVTHPVRTLQGMPGAGALGLSTPEAVKHADAVYRESVRGLESNIPLAGLAHERLTGFPEQDAADAAEAPHAASAGAVTGMAALALAPKVMPLVGRGLATAANAAQDAALSGAEASVARSAARGAAPVSTAAKELASDAMHHGIRHGLSAQAGHMIGGHTGAMVGAGLSLAKPVVKLAGTAADEGFAALARRAGVEAPAAAPRPPAIEPTGPAQAAGWDPEGWKHDQAASKSVPPAAEAAENVPRGTSPEEPEPIAIAREALKDPNVTPAQAADLKKAIAGYQERAARIGPKSAPKSASAASESADALRPERKTVQIPIQSNADLVYGDGAVKSPEAIAEPAKPELWGGRPANLGARPEEFTPSKSDEGFAKKMKMSVEDYRDMMKRRAPYLQAVEKVARLARSSTDAEEFANHASAGGISKADARRIWDAAHRPKAAAEPAAEEASP